MSRLVLTVELAATLAVTAYVLIASVQYDGAPAVSAAALAADVALSFAAFVVALVLYAAVRACHVSQLARRAWLRTLERYRIRRAVRERRRRHRARARIGATR